MSFEPYQAPAALRRLPSRLLGLAATQAERLVADGLAEIDARKWHFAVLASLAEYGPASQATLSRRTAIYRSDMVAVLNELADAGYVERALDPDDRRRNVITLTDAGHHRLAQLHTVLTGLQDDLLEPLSTTDREHLIDLLTRVLEHHATTRPPT